MTQDLKSLSTSALLSLIQEASAELSRRLSPGEPLSNCSSPPLSEGRVRPPDDEVDFVMMLKSKATAGRYITADERRRASDIGGRYPAWYQRQQLPTDSGTGSWKKYVDYMSAPRAMER